MPVVLPPESIKLWLDPEERKPEELQQLLIPFPKEKMEAFPVTTLVNNPATIPLSVPIPWRQLSIAANCFRPSHVYQYVERGEIL